jgi:hypothetical protein
LTRRVTRHFTPKPVTLDGVRFDSQSEANRAGELKLLQRGGVIQGLEFHPRLPMYIIGAVTGRATPIGRGYITLDFRYDECIDGFWRDVFEDHKPVITREAKLRIAVCEALHEIKIKLTGGRQSR